MPASYDISHDLKMAGFPQPKPKSGQFWYDNYRNLSVLSLVGQAPGADPKIMVLILDSEDTYETVIEEKVCNLR
jgi:hypothetical protein